MTYDSTDSFVAKKMDLVAVTRPHAGLVVQGEALLVLLVP